MTPFNNSMNKLIFLPLLLASIVGALGDSIKTAVICAGAATLNNGSVVTIGQPFVGLMRAADNSASLQAGIIPTFIMSPPPKVSVQINLPRLIDGRFQMTFETRPDISYQVEASTNLIEWLLIWTKGAGINSPPFDDPEASNLDFRFYRVFCQ